MTSLTPDSFHRQDGSLITPNAPESPAGSDSVLLKLDPQGALGADVSLAGKAGKRVQALISGAAGTQKYVIDEEIGRGGMGVILSAADRDFRRQVAMKQMLSDSEQDLRRFLQEAQVTGQLEHPHIVPAHEIGIAAGGQVYFTMKRVQGEDLSAVLHKLFKGNPRYLQDYPLPRLLDIFLKICDAVAFAHSKGVIHRDLKPQNIMVGGFGEVLVMDWGLAKLKGREDHAAADLVRTLCSDAGLSVSLDGLVVGTPSYMPPEQADEERVHEVDERSDVYALGAILYELLCGRPPFTGLDAYDIIAKVIKLEPEPPEAHAHAAAVSPELSAVAMKALQKNPSARYSTVTALQRDVRVFVEGGLVGAHRYSLRQRAIKWVQRHKAASLGIAAAVVALTVGVAGMWALQLEAEREIVRALQLRLSTAKALARQLPAPQGSAERSAWYAAHNAVLASARDLARLVPEGAIAHADAARALIEQLERDENFDTALMLADEIAVGLGETGAQELRAKIETARGALAKEQAERTEAMLSKYGDAAPTDELIEQYESDVIELIRMPHPHVVRLLIPAVLTGKTWQRKLAIDALGKIGDKKTRAPVPLTALPADLPPAAWEDQAFRDQLQAAHRALRAEVLQRPAPPELDALEALALALCACPLDSRLDQAVDLAWALGRLRDARAESPLDAKRWASRQNSSFWSRSATPYRWVPLLDAGAGVSAEPRTAAEFTNRGLARQAKGELDGAIADHTQAIALDPKDATAYTNRGLVRQAKGELDGAIADWKHALDVAPPDWPHRQRVEQAIRQIEGR